MTSDICGDVELRAREYGGGGDGGLKMVGGRWMAQKMRGMEMDDPKKWRGWKCMAEGGAKLHPRPPTQVVFCTFPN